MARVGKDGAITYALRFRAYGKRRYVTLGAETTTHAEAVIELENILADVRRGIWQPPTSAPIVEEPSEEPTFHEFASRVVRRNARPKASRRRRSTISAGRSSTTCCRSSPITGCREITPQRGRRGTRRRSSPSAHAIEAAREAAKAKRRAVHAAEPLERVDQPHAPAPRADPRGRRRRTSCIPSNPATGKRRRLKAEKPARPWVEPEQLMALLDARHGVGRILLAILAGGGLRIGEALALRWRDVDLGTGTLHVVDAKTPKGVREVHLTPALREKLTLWRADARHTAPADFVIHTSTGSSTTRRTFAATCSHRRSRRRT